MYTPEWIERRALMRSFFEQAELTVEGYKEAVYRAVLLLHKALDEEDYPVLLEISYDMEEDLADRICEKLGLSAHEFTATVVKKRREWWRK